MLQQDDWVRTQDSEAFGVLEHKTGDVWTVIIEGDGGTSEAREIPEYDLQLICPFCPNHDVDSDWRACPSCKEII